jgi:DNA-binding CsgD family transcriptional regulator/tetratricopeptide (TPR) repeat protein
MDADTILSQAQLPGPLRLRPSFPFVGRPREMAALRALMPRAESEGRRIALVGGETGSGKSRLVREFAHRAAGEGVLVLYGACDAVVRTPYRPVVEALDQLVRSSDPAMLRDDLGSGGGELTRLLPDLPATVGPLPDPVVADQDTERHRLNAAVTDLLVAVSHRRPVLLVVEDGHWADMPTLLLLRHLARASSDARMLLLATFRDTEADVPAELSETLVEMRRSEGVVRLRLGGLSAAEVAEFVALASGATLGDDLPQLAAAITDLTEGNAFLMTELWRALVETAVLEIHDGVARLTRPLSELGTPETVREVVSQRLSRLDPATSEVLEMAAVAGPEFDLSVLRAAGQFDADTLGAALDQSERSGMTEQVPARALRYRFTHELVRRALYDRLAGFQRAELHLQVANALEAGGAAESARGLASLAYHFAAAAPVDGPERAVEYNLRAAAAATAALAFDEAVAPLRTALHLGVPNPLARAEITLELGAACYRAGRSIESLNAFRSVAETGRRLDDPTLLARAAIGFENSCWRVAIVDEGAIELLEEALAALDPGDSELRVMLLAGLGRACSFIGDHQRSAELRQLTIEMARRIDFRPGLASVLMRSYWARGSASLDEILEMLAEAREIGEELGDIEVVAESMEWRIAALLAKGELATAGVELAAVREAADRIHQPFILHVAEQYASAIALAEGRLAESDAAAERSREWSRWLTGRDASGVHGIQMFGLRREQGRLAELAPVMRVLAGSDRPGGAWRPALAAVLAELGMHDEARRQLELLRHEGLESYRSGLWLASLTYIADACAAVDEADLARIVYDELSPHAGGNVMIGHGVACYGSTDRYLGMLAAAFGELALAEQHHRLSIAFNRRMGAQTWLAHSSYEYARVLTLQGRGDHPAAAAALLEARQLAERIGMPVLLGRIRGVASPAASPPRLPDGLSPREVEILRRVAQGMSNKEIGAALHISEHTAANHIRSILRKTGCANRTEAASYAHTRGLANRG